jgi:hypothetical protein
MELSGTEVSHFGYSAKLNSVVKEVRRREPWIRDVKEDKPGIREFGDARQRKLRQLSEAASRKDLLGQSHKLKSLVSTRPMLVLNGKHSSSP